MSGPSPTHAGAAAAGTKTPSVTHAWRCTWWLSAEPKRCRKETPPSHGRVTAVVSASIITPPAAHRRRLIGSRQLRGPGVDHDGLRRARQRSLAAAGGAGGSQRSRRFSTREQRVTAPMKNAPAWASEADCSPTPVGHPSGRCLRAGRPGLGREPCPEGLRAIPCGPTRSRGRPRCRVRRCRALRSPPAARPAGPRPP